MAKGYINKEQLSEELQNEIENSGMTEEQVNEIVDEAIGDLSQLNTNAKGNLVEALNELFQNANNGKQIIADAIGSPLTEGDTFAAMGNSINTLTTNFRNALALKGVNAPGDKFETLINRIDEIVQSGNVLNNQIMVSGEYTVTTATQDLTVEINLNFDPEYFIVYIPRIESASTDYHLQWNKNICLTTDDPSVSAVYNMYTGSDWNYSSSNWTLTYNQDSFNVTGSVTQISANTVVKWHAIGSTQLPNNGGERIITPSTTDQVLPDGYYSGDITVKGDNDLKPENILEGVEIFGVTGSASSIKLSLGDVTNFNHDFFTKKESTSGAGSGVVVLEYTIPFTGSYKIYYDWQGPSINALRYGIVKFLINDVERGNVRLSGTNRGTDAVYDLTSVNKGDRLVIKIGADDSYPGYISNIRIKGNLVIEGVDF